MPDQSSISKDVIEALLIPSTATITAVLSGHGLRNTFMHDVAPLKPGMKMAGPAFTMRYIPAREDLTQVAMDNLTDIQRIGIEQIETGEVLVIDARGETRAAVMGDILAIRIYMRGAVGVVTDGAYRASPGIADTGLAAYARGMNAHTNKTIHYPLDIQKPTQQQLGHGLELHRESIVIETYGLGFRGHSDAGAAERAIERAVELGINFIDCAEEPPTSYCGANL